MKIQINNLEALERLIGGDNELEIEVRNSVIQSFTNKHLKGLANEGLMEDTSVAVIKLLKEEFFDSVEEGSNYNKRTVLHFKNAVLKKLKTKLTHQMTTEMRKLTNEIVAERVIFDAVEERLKNACDYITDQLTNEALDKRLNAMVDKRLKEKLGL